MQKVTFLTSDGVHIVGDWYPSEGDCFALLLHMMPATKESWKDFAEALNVHGVSCLAIDERGHGESNHKEDGTEIRYKEFTDEEQMEKQLDVDAALAWLAEKGMVESKLAMVGASIGANLVITTMGSHHEIPVGIALSPGVDYRGVKTVEPIKALTENQNILLVASDEDDQSFGSVNELNEIAKERTYRIVLGNMGHGTTMFENDPELLTQCVEWITNKL